MYILKVSEDENILAPRLSGSTDRAVPVLALPDNTPSAAGAKPGVQIIAQFDLAAPGMERLRLVSKMAEKLGYQMLAYLKGSLHLFK